MSMRESVTLERLYTHTCTQEHTQTYTHALTCIHTHTCTHTQACTHAHTYTCMHIHAHVHTQSWGDTRLQESPSGPKSTPHQATLSVRCLLGLASG